jgi:CheY-specific phosphatase CheX
MVISSELSEQTLSRHVRKDILLVDRGRGELMKGLERVRDLAFELTQVSSFDVVCGLIHSTPAFAAVAVDAHGMDDDLAGRIFTAIKRKDALTPVVWLCTGHQTPPTFAGEEPDIVLNSPSSSQALSARLLAQLTGRFFPKQIQEEFDHSIVTALEENFKCKDFQIESYLKSDAYASGTISAMVSMVSDDLCGAIIISGSHEFFERCYKNIIPDSDTVLASDIAGEICNAIAGRLKGNLRNHGCRVDHAFPIIVEGHPISLGYGGPGRLNLVKSVNHTWGTVHIELFLDWVDLDALNAVDHQPDEPDQEPGSLSFF